MAGTTTPAPGLLARRGDSRAWGMAAVYTLVYSLLSLQKYRDYLYDDFDLAIFVQAVNGLLHGTLFSSIRGMNWLGDHSSLVLVLLAPIVAVFHHPLTLLVIQSAMLGLGAVPVFRLARRELDDPRAPLVCAALYLLYPALAYVNLYEFHPEALATPLLLFAFLYLREGRLKPLLACSGLALLCREDVALVVGAMGLYAALIPGPGRWRRAAALIGLAVASLVLSFGILKPVFNAGQVDFSLLYPDWGASPGGVLAGIVRHPLRAAGWLFATPGDPVDTGLKQVWVAQMLAPLLFLPLLSPPTLLIAAPIVLELLLSRGHAQHTIFYQYTALVTPFFMAAAVMGLRTLARLGVGRQRVGLVLALALFTTLASNFMFGPLAVARTDAERPQRIWPSSMDRTLRPYRDRMLARLPARGAVVAGFEFQARLAHRDSLHSLHHVLSGHYTISRLPYPALRGVSGLIAGLDPERTLASVDPGTGQRLRDLIAANGLRAADAPGNLVLYLREPEAHADSIETWSVGSFPIASPRRLVFDRALAFLGGEPGADPVTPGGLLAVRTFWERRAAADRIFMLLFVLLDPHGEPACQLSTFLGSLANPVHLWPAGRMVRATDRIVIPRDLRPGRYTLALRVGTWKDARLALAQCDAPGLAADRMLVRLGQVEVTPSRLARRRGTP